MQAASVTPPFVAMDGYFILIFRECAWLYLALDCIGSGHPQILTQSLIPIFCPQRIDRVTGERNLCHFVFNAPW
jgi:hypothetical protein